MEPTRYVSYSVQAALQKGVERRRLFIQRTDAYQPDPTIQTTIDAFVKQQSTPILIIKNFFYFID